MVVGNPSHVAVTLYFDQSPGIDEDWILIMGPLTWGMGMSEVSTVVGAPGSGLFVLMREEIAAEVLQAEAQFHSQLDTHLHSFVNVPLDTDRLTWEG